MRVWRGGRRSLYHPLHLIGKDVHGWYWTLDPDEYDRLPPDVKSQTNGDSCGETWTPPDLPYQLYCTRRLGHGGRHAASDGRKFIAVWKVIPGVFKGLGG
jgi:hypothetical protein